MALSSIQSLTLLGAGKMGSALLAGWISNGLNTGGLTIIEPFPADDLRDLVQKHQIKLYEDPSNCPVGQILVLAIKPQMMATILPNLTMVARSAVTAVSIAAGTTLATLQDLLGTGPAVRIMPNTPAQVGRGMSVGFANSRVSQENRQLVSELFEAVGLMQWASTESDLDLVTAVSGSGPAYVFHLVEALANAGVEAGLPEAMAQTLARQTVIGAGELMHQDPQAAAQLRQNVTSPGGTTAAALEILMAENGSSMTDLMTRAVAAAADRSRELAG